MNERSFDILKYAQTTQDSDTYRNVRLIAVCSGKGGVGKSNVAVNLSVALAQHNRKVLLLDADLGLANSNILMGIMPRFTMYSVIEKGANLSDVIIKTPWKVDLIAGASGYSRVADLDIAAKSKIVEELSKIVDYDYVIIDCGAGVHDNVTRFVRASTDVMIVTTPEPTALTDAYSLMKISAEWVNPHFTLRLVVNRVKDEAEAIRVASKLQTVASKFLSAKLEMMGHILEDPEMAAAVSAQKPLMVHAPASISARCIENIARRLLNLPPISVGSGFRSLWRRIFDLD